MIASLRRRLPAARYPLVALVALAVVFLGWRALQTDDGTASAGSPAPRLDLDRLGGGGSVSLAAYSGHPVVVNFWASWCGPCKDEAATLERASRQWSSQGVRFIGIDTRDSKDAAQGYVERYGVTYPVGLDPDGEMADRYGLVGLPDTVLISAQGRVESRVTGPVTGATIDDMLTRTTSGAAP